MNLKTLLALLLAVWPSMSFCQGLTAVMVNTNGVIQRPSNFWAANAQQAVNVNLNVFRSAMANLSTQQQSGTAADVTNSFVGRCNQ
jgi:uncharacterized membrane protein